MAHISSQSWLNFMWSLHNDVRNSRGIKLTGLGALNEINNYLLLFFIERKFNIYHLPDDCKFSYLYKNFCTDEKIKDDSKHKINTQKQEYNYYKVWNHWCNVSNLECILRKFGQSERIKKYIKNEVTAICAFTDNCETGKTIQLIINKIWKKFSQIAKSDDVDDIMNLDLDTFGFDAFGDAYEKFKQQSCEDSGKTTGQHFTPDVIKIYITDELKPKSSEIFYEPACGSGGFVHKISKYVKQNEGIEKYKTFVTDLMANECNPEIYKPLAINMLIHDIPIDHIRKQDSLDLGNWANGIIDSVDIIATNPPFGGGDVVQPSDYWGPLKTGKTIIKNAMAQFIMHIYNSLKNGGRCGTVSDRGILTNGANGKNNWEVKLRKFLLTKCNMYKIVLLPDNTFDYTKFKTCMIFFIKGKQTKEIEFSELKIKDTIADDQKTKEIENEDMLGKITIDRIKEKNYSLDPDDYFKKKDEQKDGYIKLGDVCELLKNPAHKAGEALENGAYNFYTSSDIIRKSNFNDFKEQTIIIGSGGNGSTFIDQNFSCSADNFLLQVKNNKFNIEYVFKYLKITFKKLYELYRGNGLKHLSQFNLLNYMIPNLTLEHQQEIVKVLDEQFKKYDINKLNKQIPIFKFLIDKKYDKAIELIQLSYGVDEALQLAENMKSQIKLIFELKMMTLTKCPIKKLGEIVDIIKGKFNSRDMSNSGDVPFYTASYNSPIGMHNDHTIDKPEYLIFIKDGGNKTNPTSETIGLGKVFYVNGKSAFTSHQLAFVPKKNINCKYLYYYLTVRKNELMLLADYGTGLGYIQMPKIINISIPVPSLEIQQDIVNKIDQLNLEASHYANYGKCLQEELNNISEILNNLTNIDQTNEIHEQDMDIKKDEDFIEIDIKKNAERNADDEIINDKSEKSDNNTEDENTFKAKKKKLIIKKENHKPNSEDENINEDNKKKVIDKRKTDDEKVDDIKKIKNIKKSTSKRTKNDIVDV